MSTKLPGIIRKKKKRNVRTSQSRKIVWSDRTPT
jgi:hypothetical protein